MSMCRKLQRLAGLTLHTLLMPSCSQLSSSLGLACPVFSSRLYFGSPLTIEQSQSRAETVVVLSTDYRLHNLGGRSLAGHAVFAKGL